MIPVRLKQKFRLLAVLSWAFIGGISAAQAYSYARYNFDQGIKTDASGRQYVVDTTGTNNVYVRAANGGLLTLIAGEVGQGKAVRFPGPCASATGCPKLILEAADDPALNPGAAPFSFGASILMTDTETTTGSNIVQKGYYSAPGGQWKLQVDTLDGRPSCVVQGMHNGVRTLADVKSPISIVGAWHRVQCVKRDTFVKLLIDGSEVARVEVVVGSVANADPLRIGGKNIQDDSDQFHGALDNVFFRLD